MNDKRMDPGAMELALQEYALGFPEAYEDFPWDDHVIKVRRKIFLFLDTSPKGFHLSVKLPQSNQAALMLRWTEPTGYGLGRAGWVRGTVPPEVPLDLLKEWVDESYRAVAPKTLVAKLG